MPSENEKAPGSWPPPGVTSSFGRPADITRQTKEYRNGSANTSTESPQERNGNGHHRPGHRQFSNDLRKLIDDLQAAEELRADELKRLQLLRASVYAAAAQHGIKPQILRAV